ncbi:aspartyl-phosphate phosphatase Spo0E family protein [Halothermothrix orenii]|uniref:aspartyl-phosphate phosphatase Spo0E family protein n=1 Tax=Halothermothrix orenii TaxID=31909 RepID=UPI000300BB32|nr:aspartyl-phosphate phosphatase Spo0E family protein [Halothermothrix orenii]
MSQIFVTKEKKYEELLDKLRNRARRYNLCSEEVVEISQEIDEYVLKAMKKYSAQVS